MTKRYACPINDYKMAMSIDPPPLPLTSITSTAINDYKMAMSIDPV